MPNKRKQPEGRKDMERDLDSSSDESETIEPPRIPNAYITFERMFLKAHPDASTKKVKIDALNRWKNMTQAEKGIFNHQAHKERGVPYNNQLDLKKTLTEPSSVIVHKDCKMKDLKTKPLKKRVSTKLFKLKKPKMLTASHLPKEKRVLQMPKKYKIFNKKLPKIPKRPKLPKLPKLKKALKFKRVGKVEKEKAGKIGKAGGQDKHEVVHKNDIKAKGLVADKKPVADQEAAKKILMACVKKTIKDAAKRTLMESLRKTIEAAAKKVKEEAAKKAKEEVAKKAKEEAAKKAKEEAAKKAKEEAAKKIVKAKKELKAAIQQGPRYSETYLSFVERKQRILNNMLYFPMNGSLGVQLFGNTAMLNFPASDEMPNTSGRSNLDMSQARRRANHIIFKKRRHDSRDESKRRELPKRKVVSKSVGGSLNEHQGKKLAKFNHRFGMPSIRQPEFRARHANASRPIDKFIRKATSQNEPKYVIVARSRNRGRYNNLKRNLLIQSRIRVQRRRRLPRMGEQESDDDTNGPQNGEKRDDGHKLKKAKKEKKRDNKKRK